MASNFRISAEISLYISALSKAASVWVKPDSAKVAGAWWVGAAVLALSAARSAFSEVLSACSPSMASFCYSICLTISVRVKWFYAQVSLHDLIPSVSASMMHIESLKLYRVSWNVRHCSVSWEVRLFTVLAHAYSMAVMRRPIAFTARDAWRFRAAPFESTSLIMPWRSPRPREIDTTP